MKNYGKTGMCNPCYNKTQENPIGAGARKVNREGYAVYHIPSIYYVGRTGDLPERWKKHHNNGINMEDCHVLSWHETEKEAAMEEMRWHLKGYRGNQGLSEKGERLLYG